MDERARRLWSGTEAGVIDSGGLAAVADGNKEEPNKVKKGIIKDIMRGENGREQNNDWLPVNKHSNV